MADYQLFVRGGLEAHNKRVYKRGGFCPWLNEKCAFVLVSSFPGDRTEKLVLVLHRKVAWEMILARGVPIERERPLEKLVVRASSE